MRLTDVALGAGNLDHGWDVCIMVLSRAVSSASFDAKNFVKLNSDTSVINLETQGYNTSILGVHPLQWQDT